MTAPAATRWRLLNWPGWSRVALAAGYFAALNALLLAPSDSFESVELFPYQDKVVHCAVFFGLAWLVRWAVPARLGVGAPAAAVAGAIAAYAFGIERLQPLLTGGDRQFEWLDLAGNYAGIAAGWLLFGVAAARAAVPATRGGAGR
jgi:hypothetical protein